MPPSASTRRPIEGRWPAAVPTVAVLACGADRAYPSAHRSLIDYIADVGLVVSEAAPGCAPTRIRFLARNRLIAAMARGTVVVEAAVRSGALNTASWAAGLGRRGDGGARPRHQRAVGGRAPADPRPRRAAGDLGGGGAGGGGTDGRYALSDPREPEQPRDRLTPRERQVLDAVPLVQAVDAPKIARTAGIAHARTKEALLVLHRAGLVEHSLGRWRVAADPAWTNRWSGWTS